MKRIMMVLLLAVMVLSTAGFTGPTNWDWTSDGPQTYTVLVGWENVHQGIGLMSFFPGHLKVHVGDSVDWKANSHEIHTVTFLGDVPLPEFVIPAPAGLPSPVQVNPLAAFPAGPVDGMFDGTGYVNSGIMSTDPGQVTDFRLTFTQPGVYEYVCIVHGMMMSAVVEVVDSSVHIPSPRQVKSMMMGEIFKALSKVPHVLFEAMHQIVPPVKNADGTKTWTVNVGYASDSIELMRFFPSRLAVKQGDTVLWQLSDKNDAPHTVTFTNGHDDSGLVLPVPQPAGPPILLLNPEILFPSQAVMDGLPLNSTDVFNSGMLQPGSPNTTFSLKIGDVTGKIDYICALHDTSGMVGSLYVGQ